jgi:hypothetical protein
MNPSSVIREYAVSYVPIYLEVARSSSAAQDHGSGPCRYHVLRDLIDSGSAVATGGIKLRKTHRTIRLIKCGFEMAVSRCDPSLDYLVREPEHSAALGRF